MSFPLSQSSTGIIDQTASITNLRENCCVRCTEANSEVPSEVHRHAAHPTPGRIRLIGALLKNGRISRDRAQLKPTHPGHAIGADSIITYDRLVAVGKFSVGKSKHEPVGQIIQISRRSHLRHKSPELSKGRSGRV